ncbi:MAG: HlyD family efflux transporter periplasmic adaptor subunit [Terrimicrobiaceae bacterium]|nr:HlyD family efflux transporter periplasmic adaptor subunit [Terrimicrobiaceae bacterium]
MSTISSAPPLPSRRFSPLCTDAYRLQSHELRPVIPPCWMKLGMLWAIGLTLAVLVVTLLSPMDEYVVASGVVRPADFNLAFSRTAGILESIEILDGARVGKGQVLARLDGWEVRKQLAEIEGDLAQTEAELALAQASKRKVDAVPVPPEFFFSAVEVEGQQEIQGLQKDYLERLDQLRKTGAASGLEMMNLRLRLIETDSLLKRNQLANELYHGDYGKASQSEAADRVRLIEIKRETLRAKRGIALGDLSRLEIVAPESGMVIATARRLPGEPVEAGAPLFKITSGRASELRLYAGEDRVNLIAPGQAVRFRANNNPDRLAPFAVGRVTAVARDRDTALVDNDAGGGQAGPYLVTVAIERQPYELANGATVNAEIILGRRPFWRLLFMKAAHAPLPGRK